MDNNKILIETRDLQNQIIGITGDGNCLFRIISKYLNRNEKEHINFWKNYYEYTKNDIVFFHEYYYVEN